MLVSILYYSFKKAIKYSIMFDPLLLPSFVHLKSMHTHRLIIISNREGGLPAFLPQSWSYMGSAKVKYSCLENPMDGGAWQATVHGVAKSRTRLSNFTFTFHFPALEKEMATHSSVLAWRIPGTGEPGGLPSKGSHRVGHDWIDLAAAAKLRKNVDFLWYKKLSSYTARELLIPGTSN